MKRFLILLLLTLLLIPTGVALAGPSDRIIRAGESVDEDITIVGDELEVEEGATVNGDVLILGGNVTLAGTVNGSVTVWGGNIELSGSITGDLVMLGGNVEMVDAAAVSGECALLGGNIDDEDSLLNCAEIGDGSGFQIPVIPGLPPIPPIEGIEPAEPARPDAPHVIIEHNESGIGEAIGRSLTLGLLALVVAALFPAQLNQVSDVISQRPVASGTVGLLTAVAAPSLMTLLALIFAVLILAACLGLLGFPILLLMGVALGAAVTLGWISVGNLLGRRLAEGLKLNNRNLTTTAALGTLVLTLVAGVMSQLSPWLGGWLWATVGVVLACVGLGAVALTKFGTRPYPPPAPDEAKVAAVLETLPDEE
jgi:hypothetical protein